MEPEFGPEFAEALVAIFAAPLTTLGFHVVDVLEDGVRFESDQTRFEARYVPRDGELAVYVIPRDTGEPLSLLLYLRAVESDAAGLGEAVAESSDQALEIACEYARALPEITKLLVGDPVELARARNLRWWHVG